MTATAVETTETHRPDRSDGIAELAKALSAAQREVETASKDSVNPHFNRSYADLASVWQACREPLTKNGLSVMQRPVSEGNRVGVITTVLHSSGQWMESTLWTVPQQAGPQAMGSCITYLRRYSLSAVAGVAPDDDDGNAASPRGKGRETVDPAYKATVGASAGPKAGATAVAPAASRAATATTSTTRPGGAPGKTIVNQAREGAAPESPVNSDDGPRQGPKAPPPNGTKERRDSGAKDIAHDGSKATKKQVDLMHVLRSKIPALAATPEDPRSQWRTKIGVYPKQATGPCEMCKGTGAGKSPGADCKTCQGRGKMCPRVEHCNEMSIAQATHFIMRMEATLEKHTAATEEIRTGPPQETLPPLAPATFAESLHDRIPTATEEAEFLGDLGFSDADAVPPESREMVLQLLIAKAQGPSAYATAMTKARALGHVHLRSV